MTPLKRYVLTCILFISAMSVKFFMVDRPAWGANLWQYAISTMIVIPIVWYAGYFFREWRETKNMPLQHEGRAPLS